MTDADRARSFYLFDIDDNLLFLPTVLYLWNAEAQQERTVASGEFAAIQNMLGRPGAWQSWAVREETFRDFRDRPGLPAEEQSFVRDLQAAVAGGTAWRGPSWALLVHAATNQRAIAMVTARGHAPATIEAGLRALVDARELPAVPPIHGIYTVTNPEVRALVGAGDPAMTVPSVKKLAIRHAVDTALQRYGSAPTHRFGMSDDDPNNVVLAISAMRDCKLAHPDKRFFVINTNHLEPAKLEVFPMAHPVTALASGAVILGETPGGDGVHDPGAREPGAREPGARDLWGGNVSVYVSDMERAIEFYSGPLGLPLRTRVGSDWAELDAGRGLVIGLHPARPPATPKAGTTGAINIELAVTRPLNQVVDALIARGVPFAGPIQEYENVRLASLSDPDGNAILLAQVLNAGTAP
jgi:predicted enzyme related to lactoylglutathione lyase